MPMPAFGRGAVLPLCAVVRLVRANRKEQRIDCQQEAVRFAERGKSGRGANEIRFAEHNWRVFNLEGCERCLPLALDKSTTAHVNAESGVTSAGKIQMLQEAVVE